MEHRLLELAKVFFRLGCFAFGGPAAHIAMLENEVVKKRQWMSHAYFLDLVGATNLIPGPNSTEMAMHCGHERAGWRGLLIAGVGFIVPAVIITGFLAWLYQRYGLLPQVAPFTYGIKPAVIAIIIGALYALGKKAVKSLLLAITGIGVLTVCMLGMNEITALLAAGALTMLIQFFKTNHPKPGSVQSLLPFGILQGNLPEILQNPNLKIGWIFLKVGAVLYGSGYVLYGLLDGELVSKGLLTRQQLIDAIAVGQITPGPVLSTATFIGWQLNGFSGALFATIGVFLPSFFFVWIFNPLIPKMRKSKSMGAFLDGVNVAAVAIIAMVCIEMGKDTLTDWKTIVIALCSLAATMGLKKLNSAFIVAGGSLLGYVLQLL